MKKISRFAQASGNHAFAILSSSSSSLSCSYSPSHPLEPKISKCLACECACQQAVTHLSSLRFLIHEKEKRSERKTQDHDSCAALFSANLLLLHLHSSPSSFLPSSYAFVRLHKSTFDRPHRHHQPHHQHHHHHQRLRHRGLISGPLTNSETYNIHTLTKHYTDSEERGKSWALHVHPLLFAPILSSLLFCSLRFWERKSVSSFCCKREKRRET